MTHIYFIQQEKTNCIKIGKSASVRRRLANLSSASPYELKVIAIIDPGRTSPLKLEMYLHKRFTQFNMRGEWFEGSPEILEFALNYASDTIPIKIAPELEELEELQPDPVPQIVNQNTGLAKEVLQEEFKQQRIWEEKMVDEGRAYFINGGIRFWT